MQKPEATQPPWSESVLEAAVHVAARRVPLPTPSGWRPRESSPAQGAALHGAATPGRDEVGAGGRGSHGLDSCLQAGNAGGCCVHPLGDPVSLVLQGVETLPTRG